MSISTKSSTGQGSGGSKIADAGQAQLGGDQEAAAVEPAVEPAGDVQASAQPDERDMPTTASMEAAARAWCDPACGEKVMDAELATSFARILDVQSGSFETQISRLWQIVEALGIKGLEGGVDGVFDAILAKVGDWKTDQLEAQGEFEDQAKETARLSAELRTLNEYVEMIRKSPDEPVGIELPKLAGLLLLAGWARGDRDLASYWKAQLGHVAPDGTRYDVIVRSDELILEAHPHDQLAKEAKVQTRILIESVVAWKATLKETRAIIEGQADGASVDQERAMTRLGEMIANAEAEIEIHRPFLDSESHVLTFSNDLRGVKIMAYPASTLE